MNIKGGYIRPLFILTGDILLVLFSYLAGYWIRFGYISGFSEKFPLWFIPLIIINYLAIFYFFDLHTLKENYFTVSFFVKISLAIAVSSVTVLFFNYIIFLFPIGRGILIIANLILLFSAFVWRGFCQKIFKFLVKPIRLIIVGAGKTGKEIARIIKSARNDFEVVGFVEDSKGRRKKSVHGEKINILGTSEQLMALSEEHRIDLIVFAYKEHENPQLTKNILNARLKGIEVINMPDMYQSLKKRIPINYVEEDWFLKEKGFEHSNNMIVIKVKRLIDIIVSLFILLISMPLWPIISLLIKINSRGPIFYIQKRVGKNESIFSLKKFRSMIDKAEEDEAIWADENDERITLMGRMLRILHLDELPQLLNVIKGEMSLVGPRPERPEFVEELKKKIPYYSLRHFMKPGITGWAQVNYPYASSLEDSQEKLEYDLYYISHMNLLLEARILLKTVQKILLGEKRIGIKRQL
ncbi:MAG: sugar transferase [Candidatus Aminicenantes bacterium]|nr:sugar transferase [Candidatus Aminicenantes bacterium]